MNIKEVKIEIKGKEIEVDNKTQRAHLIGLLGEPDDIGCISRKNKKGLIFKYDKIEFRFCSGKIDATLYLVYSETKEGICEIAIPFNGF